MRISSNFKKQKNDVPVIVVTAFDEPQSRKLVQGTAV
jgi:hypothetical protein